MRPRWCQRDRAFKRGSPILRAGRADLPFRADLVPASDASPRDSDSRRDDSRSAGRGFHWQTKADDEKPKSRPDDTADAVTWRVLAAETRLDALARVGRALADPTRCRLLLALSTARPNPSELAGRLGLTRANTSNHLACLRGCGLVLGEAEGRQVRYQLADANLAHALADLADVVLVLGVDVDRACMDSHISVSETIH